MCAIVLKVKYRAQAEPDALIECESTEAAQSRMAGLQALETVDSIAWFVRGVTHTRSVVWTPDPA